MKLYGDQDGETEKIKVPKALIFRRKLFSFSANTPFKGIYSKMDIEKTPVDRKMGFYINILT